MGKKQKKTVAPQDFTSRREELPKDSPFSNIVLKERTAPEKTQRNNTKTQPKKKAGEIVKGYNPNASFADILSSYEKTGNPYAMPKKKASGVNASAPEEKQDFGAILDMWEGKGKKKKDAPERARSEYKATRSFADILGEYEEKPRPRPFPVEPPKQKAEPKPEPKKVEKAKSFSEILPNFEEKKEEPEAPEVKSREVRNISDIIGDVDEPDEDLLNRTFSAKPRNDDSNQNGKQKREFVNSGRRGQKSGRRSESEVKVAKSFAEIFGQFEAETEKKAPETRGLDEIISSVKIDEKPRKHEDKRAEQKPLHKEESKAETPASEKKAEPAPVEKKAEPAVAPLEIEAGPLKEEKPAEVKTEAPAEPKVEAPGEVEPAEPVKEEAPEAEPVEVKAEPAAEEKKTEEVKPAEPVPEMKEEAKAPVTEVEKAEEPEAKAEEKTEADSEKKEDPAPAPEPETKAPSFSGIKIETYTVPEIKVKEMPAEPAAEEKKPAEPLAGKNDASVPPEEEKAPHAAPVAPRAEPAGEEAETEPVKEDVQPAGKKEEPKGETPDAEALFRKKDEDEERNPRASWSVFGDNGSFRRPDPPKTEKKNSERKDRNGRERDQRNGGRDSRNGNDRNRDRDNNRRDDRRSGRESGRDQYRPRKDFGRILDSYDENPKNREREKTFDEILAEKGDVVRKARTFTVSQLRTMNPQSTLDLHGLTQDEAEARVKAFLVDCKDNNIRKISIITGKGLHSEGGVCVLRDRVVKILDSSGFITERQNAPINCGGSGALWVILKKAEDIY